MTKKLYIRADGNSDIGLGHIMRSMTIANEFRKHGFECTFLSSDPINKDIFIRYSFDYIELQYPYHKKSKNEAEYISELLKKNNVDYVLVDSYFINNNYLQILKKYSKVICINSIRKMLETDYLINENIACDRDFIGSLYLGTNTKLILGADYSPIREEFIGIAYEVKKTVTKILVTTGGGDQYNFMTSLLRDLRETSIFESLELLFVSGGCNSHFDELYQEVKKNNNVKVVKNATNMAELMKGADLAITAGGTTVLELAAIGVPTIGIAVADDQEAGLGYMSRVRMIKYAGRITELDFWVKLRSQLMVLINDYSERKSLSDNSKKIIDGKGAERIYYQIEGVRNGDRKYI